MNLKNVNNKVKNSTPSRTIIEKGFYLDYKLLDFELEKIKSYINDQWLYRLQIEDSNIIKHINKNNLEIEDYHLLSEKIKNNNIWNKISRVLPPSFADWISSSSFYKKLKEDFGEFEVSDEENFGWPNFYWRIVRPNQSNDIGPLHRDSWFWKLNKSFKKPSYKFKRIKVWMAIITEPGLNGLMIEEYSHKRNDIKWSGELRHNIQKPVLITELSELKPVLIDREPGQLIVFHDDLLHGGAINMGKKSRISLEFTMLVKLN